MKKLFVLLFASILALAGCGADTEGIYVFPQPEVEGMDVNKISYSHSFQLAEDIYSGLFRVDGEGNLQNEIVDTYTLSDDELVYTFNLRDDFYWTNQLGEVVEVEGEQQMVTADDFVYAWQKGVDPSRGSVYSFIFEPILNATEIAAGEMAATELGVKAIDPQTLEVTLRQPTPYFTSMLGFQAFYPINQNAVEMYGDEYGTKDTTTWYNGPFYVQTYNASFVIETRKNLNYPKNDEVQLAGVDYRTMDDATGIYNSFKSGEIDYAGFPTKEDYAAAKADGTATDALTGYMFYVYMNNSESSPLSDSNLRHALYYSFDREGVLENLYGEKNQPIEYVIPRDLTSSSYGAEYRDFAEDSYVTYDPAKGQEYLDTYMQENGISDASTIELELVSSDSELGKKTAEAVAAAFNQTLGINVTITSLPSLSFYDAVDAGNFDMQIGGWGPDYADPSTYFSIWTTGAIGSVNGAHYSNPEYDAAYAEASKLTDYDERMTAFAELEKMVMDDAAFIPFYQKNEAYVEADEFESHHLLFQKVSNKYTSYNG